MNEKQNWIGERKRWVFDDKQNRVSTLKLCKINEKQNRIVEKKDGYPTNLERKVEQDFSEKKMGVEGKVDQNLWKKNKKNKKNKKKNFSTLSSSLTRFTTKPEVQPPGPEAQP